MQLIEARLPHWHPPRHYRLHRRTLKASGPQLCSCQLHPFEGKTRHRKEHITMQHSNGCAHSLFERQQKTNSNSWEDSTSKLYDQHNSTNTTTTKSKTQRTPPRTPQRLHFDVHTSSVLNPITKSAAENWQQTAVIECPALSRYGPSSQAPCWLKRRECFWPRSTLRPKQRQRQTEKVWNLDLHCNMI